MKLTGSLRNLSRCTNMHLRSLQAGCVTSLLLLVGLLGRPQSLHAGTIGFRNDTKIPVIVQGMGIVNNVVVQGRRHTLQPGAICYERIRAAGQKIIIVVDARQPTRVLFRRTINVAGTDLFFSIYGEDAQGKNKRRSSDSGRPAGVSTSRTLYLTSVDLIPISPPAAVQDPSSPPTRFMPSSSKPH